MTDFAVRVERLGKRYRIGRSRPKYQTLRDSIRDAAMAPFQGLRSLCSSRKECQSRDVLGGERCRF